MESRHELVIRVEGHFRHAGIHLAGAIHADAAFLRQHDQRAFGGVADQGAVFVETGVGAQRHGQQDLLEIDLGAACAQQLAFGAVGQGIFLPGLQSCNTAGQLIVPCVP